jgi:hypothetical protein
MTTKTHAFMHSQMFRWNFRLDERFRCTDRPSYNASGCKGSQRTGYKFVTGETSHDSRTDCVHKASEVKSV